MRSTSYLSVFGRLISWIAGRVVEETEGAASWVPFALAPPNVSDAQTECGQESTLHASITRAQQFHRNGGWSPVRWLLAVQCVALKCKVPDALDRRLWRQGKELVRSEELRRFLDSWKHRRWTACFATHSPHADSKVPRSCRRAMVWAYYKQRGDQIGKHGGKRFGRDYAERRWPATPHSFSPG